MKKPVKIEKLKDKYFSYNDPQKTILGELGEGVSLRLPYEVLNKINQLIENNNLIIKELEKRKR